MHEPVGVLTGLLCVASWRLQVHSTTPCPVRDWLVTGLCCVAHRLLQGHETMQGTSCAANDRITDWPALRCHAAPVSACKTNVSCPRLATDWPALRGPSAPGRQGHGTLRRTDDTGNQWCLEVPELRWPKPPARHPQTDSWTDSTVLHWQFVCACACNPDAVCVGL